MIGPGDAWAWSMSVYRQHLGDTHLLRTGSSSHRLMPCTIASVSDWSRGGSGWRQTLYSDSRLSKFLRYFFQDKVNLYLVLNMISYHTTNFNRRKKQHFELEKEGVSQTYFLVDMWTRVRQLMNCKIWWRPQTLMALINLCKRHGKLLRQTAEIW